MSGKDSFTAVSTDLECWQQPAGDVLTQEFEKKGITVTNKVYFKADPGVDTSFQLVVTNPQTGTTHTLDVQSRAKPDASAGLGILFRVMAEEKTTD